MRNPSAIYNGCEGETVTDLGEGEGVGVFRGTDRDLRPGPFSSARQPPSIGWDELDRLPTSVSCYAFASFILRVPENNFQPVCSMIASKVLVRIFNHL